MSFDDINEGRKLLKKAKELGSEAAFAYLESEWFIDFLWDFLIRGVEEVPSKKEAKRWAKNTLIDIFQDAQRRLNVDLPFSIERWEEGRLRLTQQEAEEAWWNAYHDALLKNSTINWLADEIISQTEQKLG